MPEQAAYRVHHYHLDVEVFPEIKQIEGILTINADVVQPMSWLVLDLDTVFQIHNIGTIENSSDYATAGSLLKSDIPFLSNSPFLRHEGRVWIDLKRTYQPGEKVSRSIHYGGKPRIAPNPPWDGGFSWELTPDGAHWIGVSCQGHGADIWWPVKDHPSDRPDSMHISITVPHDLTAVSNGRYLSTFSNNDETATWNWFVSTPISNYNVTLNIGPYTTIEDIYISTAGDTMDVIFWKLPQDKEPAKKLFPQFAEQLRFFEELLGPYPFRADKYGVVQTSFLGMEHQTLIAYGAGFRNDILFNMDAGYDDLHHHELAHEWWGNLVAAHDWKDMWIHEGFATYMQALYVEHLKGEEEYFRQMSNFRALILNRAPLAPRETSSMNQIFSGRDIYFKGASVLHTLRFLLGDDDFFTILRRFAYPNPELELTTDGSAMRFADTKDFLHLVEVHTNRNLAWFFDVYMHQPELPELRIEQDGRQLQFFWETPVDADFEMPVPIKVNGRTHIISMDGGKGEFRLPRRSDFEVDSDGWVLRKATRSPEE